MLAQKYISPPVANLRDSIIVNSFTSMETIGPELIGVDTALVSSVWTAANLLVFVPLIVAEPLLVSQFFWRNGATIAGNTDVGIYSFDGATKFGSTGSTANAGSANALQSVDVANFFLPANSRLWLALGSDSGTHTYFLSVFTAIGLDFVGVTQQSSGWSSGLPATIVPAIPTGDKLPLFGFTGNAVI